MRRGLLLVLLFTGSVSFADKTRSKSPRILDVSGKAQVRTARDAHLKPASTRIPLVENATFRTGADGRIKVEVSKQLEIEILPESEVSFPGISWDSGIVPVIKLERGQLRWKQRAEGASRLSSELFELNPPPGDFVFQMNPETAEAGVQVFQGEISFKAMNAENAVSVPSGKKIRFRGVLEEGEIAYDILLQGKKIPRGSLGKMEDLSPAELEPFRRQEKLARERIEAAERARKAQKTREKKAGLICASPKARFNECAWICENNPKGAKNCQTQRADVTCYRVRCNANGEWADRLNLSAEEGLRRCRATALVEACDY